MGWLARLGLSIVGLSGLLVAGVIVIGASSQEAIAIYYHENEGQLYTMSVEDLARHHRLHLAGTRCFGDLPPWVYPANPEDSRGGPDVGRTSGWGSDDGDVIVARLRCRR